MNMDVIRSGPIGQRVIGAVGRFSRSDGGSMLLVYTIATLVLRLASNMALTRLLEPAAFGILGVISSVMTVLAMLSDFGFASFIVRHEKGGDPEFLDVLWTIRLIQSVVQTVVMLASAAPIALLLGKPAMAMPLAACAPIFLLNAFCPMAMVLAQRQGQVRKACAIDLGALAAQIAVNLAIAIVIRDYRALIVGMYASSLARIALTYLILHRPSHLRFDRAAAREFFGFSRIIMVSSFLTLLLSQSDKVIFARLFSLADFGVYMLAANLALSTQPFGRNYVQRFFFPLVSRVWRESPDTLATIIYAARRRIYPLLFAGFGLGIGAAPIFFAIVFDHRYEHGWILLSVLLLRSALDLDSFAAAEILLATGRTTTNLYANLLRAVILAIVLLLSYRPLGPISLPLALVAAEAAATLYLNILLIRLKLFRGQPHAVYYIVLALTFGAGAAVSYAIQPALVRAGLATLHI